MTGDQHPPPSSEPEIAPQIVRSELKVDRSRHTDDSGVVRERGSDGVPRWMTVLGVVVVVLVILSFVALHLSGAVGPGAHR